MPLYPIISLPDPCHTYLTGARCHRLGKQCTTPAPVPRKIYRNKSSRVSDLEERVDKLTSLLTAAQKSSDVPDPVSFTTPPTSTSSTLTYEPAPGVQELRIVLDGDVWKEPSPYPEPRGPVIDQDDIDRFSIAVSPVLEEQLFSTFRAHMNKYFPFVIIPPQATTAAIRNDKPFFFRTCTTSACHGDPLLQHSLGEELLRSLGDPKLLRGEKSLDILQGNIV